MIADNGQDELVDEMMPNQVTEGAFVTVRANENSVTPYLEFEILEVLAESKSLRGLQY